MLSGLNQGLKETTTAGRKWEGSSAIFLSIHRTNSFGLDKICTPLAETQHVKVATCSCFTRQLYKHFELFIRIMSEGSIMELGKNSK